MDTISVKKLATYDHIVFYYDTKGNIYLTGAGSHRTNGLASCIICAEPGVYVDAHVLNDTVDKWKNITAHALRFTPGIIIANGTRDDSDKESIYVVGAFKDNRELNQLLTNVRLNCITILTKEIFYPLIDDIHDVLTNIATRLNIINGKLEYSDWLFGNDDSIPAIKNALL